MFCLLRQASIGSGALPWNAGQARRMDGNLRTFVSSRELSSG
jgi:hypothetical protein